jgi:hypothetical protein
MIAIDVFRNSLSLTTMYNSENHAPIALFVYKRPDHTRKALDALIKNPEFSESKFFVYCDGPRHDTDISLVQAVRDLVRSYSLPNIVQVERDRNLGLANSIITGVTELCDKYGKVIVLEDDLVVSPFFLNYMNSALQRYEADDQVMQISGHMFPLKLETDTDAIFLPFTTSWGWATWGRAWKIFDPNMHGFDRLKADKSLRFRFNINGTYQYFGMLQKQANGEIDSWAIRWYLSVFLQNGITLYPTKSLVGNTGFDGSGTHCSKSVNKADQLSGIVKPITDFPASKVEPRCFNLVTCFLARENSFVNRLTRRLGAIFT